MKIGSEVSQDKIIIRPGEYYASNQRVMISTLLGSCVAACLYDCVHGIVGMNHFLLSNKRYLKERSAMTDDGGRYGVHAMELLINEMFKLGAERKHLRAKVFGGGSFFKPWIQTGCSAGVGEVNSRFILAFLKNDGIPIMACDLGGNQGRSIYFSSDDYSVVVKKTRVIRVSEMLSHEKRLWQKFIRRHTHGKEDIDLWM